MNWKAGRPGVVERQVIRSAGVPQADRRDAQVAEGREPVLKERPDGIIAL